MKPKMNVGVKNVARPTRFGQRKPETLKAKKIVICFQLVRWHFENSEQCFNLISDSCLADDLTLLRFQLTIPDMPLILRIF